MRSSVDGGMTWSPLRTLQTNAGQPTATFDRRRNRTVLVYNTKIGAGCEGGGCCPVKRMFSLDGGATWSLPATVQPMDPIAWPARAGPGVGIQLSAQHSLAPGRLINIGWHFNRSVATSFDTIFYSDDGGSSWQQPRQPMQLGTPCDEAQVVELPNGDILAMMRPTVKDEACPLCRQLSLSQDGGKTWGWNGATGAWYAEPQLNGAICMGSIFGGLNGVTYAAFPNNTDGSRTQGVVRVSFGSDLTSWRDHISFGSGPFAYSCLTAVPSGDHTGILWETGADGCDGPSCRSVFSTFPVALTQLFV